MHMTYAGRFFAAWSVIGALANFAAAGDPYEVWVSNERSGDVTVVDAATQRVVATVPAGKRPRGIHASPDGAMVFVALSGSPISTPPSATTQSATRGAARGPAAVDDDDAKAPADRAADGIGILDTTKRTLVGRINAGADPENFAVSPMGHCCLSPTRMSRRSA